MPSTPYAKLLVSLNAGPTQSGGVTAANGDSVQFSAESTAQWDLTTPPRWEIYAYPPGWTGPGTAGWVTESVPSPFGGTSDVYVFTGLGPPTAFTLPALPMWGDFLCKLTVAGGLLNGLPSAQLVDNTTALRIVGPGGLTDIAVSAETQFDTARSWVGSWQDDLRILDAALVGAATPYVALPEPVEIGAGSAGAVLNYSKGDHSHPVTVGIPTTIAIGDAAAAGGGTALAGAAHVHALPAPTVVNNVSSGASSLGASTAVAREDHAHQLTFATLNTILGTASAPITVNGQTLTSGGFIGPYFSTNAANPSTTGLLRGVHNSVLVASRDNGNTGDVPLISYGTDGNDILTLGDATVPCVRLRTASGCDFEFYNDADLLYSLAQNSIAIGAANTFLLTQTTGAGAGGTATIRAQGGAAGTNGGKLVLSAGVPGAGGAPTGVDLELEDSATVSGTLTVLGGAFSALMTVQYVVATGFTTLSIASPDNKSMIEAKELVIKADNATLFGTTTGSYGSGTGVLYMPNATTAPTADITSGIGVYASSDALRARNHALTVLAPDVESAPGNEDLRAPDRRAKRTTTTDATVTTAYAYTLPDNCVALMEARVVVYGPADGTSAVYKLAAGAKRFSAGAATQIGTTVVIVEQEDNAALAATIDMNSNDMRVRVTGIALTTFEWFVTVDVTLMQP